MPTFTAIALDRLIEPGASKSMALSGDSNNSGLERRHSISNAVKDNEKYPPPSQPNRDASIPPRPKLARGVSVPPNPKTDKEVPVRLNRKIDRTSSLPPVAAPSVVEKKHRWTQISPALYTTPKSTPLPDTPTSFPPSPYIINHKRRGPRLMKSYSVEDVAAAHEPTIDEVKVDGNENGVEEGIANESKDDSFIPISSMESTLDDSIKSSMSTGDLQEKHLNGICNDNGSSDVQNGAQGKDRALKHVTLNLPQEGDGEVFVDPQDSMSGRSNSDSEGGITWEERASKFMTPMAEFYDAWEELSSDSGSHHLTRDLETEEHEIRLSLLVEIEKRKQVEETLNNVQNQWKMIREQFSVVGLTLPEDPSKPLEEDLGQQLHIVRFVSNAIGRAAARAEVEMEMEAQINLKNFEIARLWDRLHYYEAVNQEMSQRNQEVVETARRLRQRRKRQKWVWGSIAAAVSVGSTVLAYSYFKGSSSSQSHQQQQQHKPN